MKREKRAFGKLFTDNIVFIALTALFAAAAVTAYLILMPRADESLSPAVRDSAVTVFTARPDAPSELIDLNEATVEELMTVKGIGRSAAQQIVDYREQNGGFISVEELSNISGISPEVRARAGSFFTV